MKALATERNRVLSTKDYGLFKYKIHRLNERKLNILVDEMSIKNISKDSPIIVDAEFNILDGRYRFEANKKLIAPVYFKVAEVANKLDLMKASSLATKPSNYEYVLMHQDKLAYRKVLEWANILPYSFEDIIRLLNYSYLVGQNRGYNNMFKNGEMEYSKEHEFKLNKVKEFNDIFCKKYENLLLDLTETDEHLDCNGYNVDDAVKSIEGLFYFSEFVKLKQSGHPGFQDFSAYKSEAIRCKRFKKDMTAEDISILKKYKIKAHDNIIDAILEINDFGQPNLPLLYSLHNIIINSSKA